MIKNYTLEWQCVTTLILLVHKGLGTGKSYNFFTLLNKGAFGIAIS